jgi:hypothetical protein
MVEHDAVIDWYTQELLRREQGRRRRPQGADIFERGRIYRCSSRLLNSFRDFRCAPSPARRLFRSLDRARALLHRAPESRVVLDTKQRRTRTRSRGSTHWTAPLNGTSQSTHIKAFLGFTNRRKN